MAQTAGHIGVCSQFGAECDAPRQFADLDRLDDLQRRDVDDRDIVRDAVGDQQIFFVGRETAVPDALADQQILEHLVRRPSTTATRLAGPRETKPSLPSLVRLMPTGWICSARSPGISNFTLCLMRRVAGSRIVRPPPTSEVAQSSEPSALKAEKRGREPSRTLATILCEARVDEMRHAGRFRSADERSSNPG